MIKQNFHHGVSERNSLCFCGILIFVWGSKTVGWSSSILVTVHGWMKEQKSKNEQTNKQKECSSLYTDAQTDWMIIKGGNRKDRQNLDMGTPDWTNLEEGYHTEEQKDRQTERLTHMSLYKVRYPPFLPNNHIFRTQNVRTLRQLLLGDIK